MAAAVMQLISSLGVGGAERLLIDYLRVAAKLPRPQVAVVMNAGEAPGFRRELEACGAPIYFLGRRPGAPSPAILATLLRLARRHGVGIIHSHNPGSMLWSCLIKASAPKLKLAHTLHGEGAVGVLRGPLGTAHRRMIAGSVAVSASVEAAARAAGLWRVTRIDNGVALGRFSPSEPRLLIGPLRLVCIGRLAPEKGQDLLIDALAICRTDGVPFQARLIGGAAPENGAYLAELNARIRRLGLRDLVTLEGGRTDVTDILSEADLFVLPSRSEGFGLALVEAMAAGVPAVAADTGGPGRILRDHPGAGLLFQAGSAAALAERICAVARDDALRPSLAGAGPIAAQSYAIERMVERYEAFYAAL